MERMGYPTPPLSSGRHSPKTSSLPPYASQLTQGQYNVEVQVQRPGHNSRTHSYNNRNQRQLGLIGDAPHDETKSYYQGAYDAETRTYAETAYDDENRTYVGQSSPTTYTKPYYPSSPTHTYRTPRSRTGSPILQRIPSPYSASRPKPRKGFVKRVISKFREWVRRIARYAARHPLKMGLMSLLPVVAIGGMVKGLVSAGRGLMKFLGEEGKREKKGGKENKSEDKKPSGDGIFDQFVKFGGSKGGPLDGILKIMQMLVNHYCKLTPHAFPRAASIILELYFLEPWKL